MENSNIEKDKNENLQIAKIPLDIQGEYINMFKYQLHDYANLLKPQQVESQINSQFDLDNFNICSQYEQENNLLESEGDKLFKDNYSEYIHKTIDGKEVIRVPIFSCVDIKSLINKTNGKSIDTN